MVSTAAEWRAGRRGVGTSWVGEDIGGTSTVMEDASWWQIAPCLGLGRERVAIGVERAGSVG